MMRGILIIGAMMVVLVGCNKPSKMEQYRAEKHVRDSVGLVDQQRSLAFYESQLELLKPKADSLLPYFKYEKNEKYQDHGNYVLTGKNGLRILVRDDGKELLLYKEGKRIASTNDPEYERAQELQIVINDIHELEKRIDKTSLEIQKYEKRMNDGMME